MSFILDAIKKSEDRRNQNKPQDAHSLQSQMRPVNVPRSRRWFEFLIAALLLMFAGWFFYPVIFNDLQLTQRIASVGEERVSNDAASSIGTITGNEGASDSEPVARDNQRQQFAMDDELPPRHQIKELWELPADFQQSVPEMEFSFHFFSKKDGKSSVVINGRSLREGQMIASKTKLRLITTTGVIIFHGGRFFHVDVVEKW